MRVPVAGTIAPFLRLSIIFCNISYKVLRKFYIINARLELNKLRNRLEIARLHSRKHPNIQVQIIL